MIDLRKEINSELEKVTGKIFFDEVFVGAIQEKAKKVEELLILIFGGLTGLLIILSFIFKQYKDILSQLGALFLIISGFIILAPNNWIIKFVAGKDYERYREKAEKIESRKKEARLLKWEAERLEKEGGNKK